jgi:hypothetical protein
MTVVRNSDSANRLANLKQLAREAAAVICKELNAREFAKLGEPRTWFDLQGASAYLAIQRADAQPLRQRTNGAAQREGRQRPPLSSQ